MVVFEELSGEKKYNFEKLQQKRDNPIQPYKYKQNKRRKNTSLWEVKTHSPPNKTFPLGLGLSLIKYCGESNTSENNMEFPN